MIVNATLDSTVTRSKQCSNPDRVIFIPALGGASEDGGNTANDQFRNSNHSVGNLALLVIPPVHLHTRDQLLRCQQATISHIGLLDVYGSPDPRAEGPTTRVERIHQPRQSRSAFFEETKAAVQTNGHSSVGKLF